MEEDSEEWISLTIKTINNDSYVLQATKCASISSIKALIEEKISVPVDLQRLIYRGRVLNDDDMLNNHKIESGHVIHLVVRPHNFREIVDQAQGESPPSLDNPTTVETSHPSMEHIRQNMLTIRTLLSTMKADNSTSEAVSFPPE